jgi:hypothetical protein
MTNRVSKIIDDEKLNRIIQIESAGNPEARAKTSSAAGLGQFLKGTWNDMGKRYYPDAVRSAGDKWADMRVGKATADLQLRVLARFCEENAKLMGSVRDGDLYLAHFLGAGAAMKVVRADQHALASAFTGEAAARANPTIIPGKTCAELRAWADASMRKRWDSAGKKDWVGIWGEGKGELEKGPPVDAKKEGAGTAGTVAGGIGGGVVVAGGAKAAGLDWTTVIVMGVCLAIVIGAVIAIIRAARKVNAS